MKKAEEEADVKMEDKEEHFPNGTMSAEVMIPETMTLDKTESPETKSTPRNLPCRARPAVSASTVRNERTAKSRFSIREFNKSHTGIRTWKDNANPRNTADETSEPSEIAVSSTTETKGLLVRGTRSQVILRRTPMREARLTAGTDNLRPEVVEGDQRLPKKLHQPPETTEEVLRATEIVTKQARANELVELLLNDHTVVALDCKGPGDEISLLTVATGLGKCYIFDMYSCPRMMAESRLRELLENKNVVKVIHDCNEASVLLYREYRVRLTNVFETRCTFNAIEAQHSTKPTCVWQSDHMERPISRNLVSSIYGRSLLNLIKDPMKRLQRQNPKFWAVRPLSSKVVDFVARDALCLVPEVYENMLKAIKPETKKYLDQVIRVRLEPFTVDSNENSLEPTVVELCQLWQDVVEKAIVMTETDSNADDSGYFPSSEGHQNNLITSKTSDTSSDVTSGRRSSGSTDADEEDNATSSVAGSNAPSKKTPSQRKNRSLHNRGSQSIPRVGSQLSLKRKTCPEGPSSTDASTNDKMSAVRLSSSNSDEIHRNKKMRTNSPMEYDNTRPCNEETLEDMNSEGSEDGSDKDSIALSNSSISFAQALSPFMPPHGMQSMPNLFQNNFPFPTGRVIHEVGPGMHAVHLSFEDLTAASDEYEIEEFSDEDDSPTDDSPSPKEDN